MILFAVYSIGDPVYASGFFNIFMGWETPTRVDVTVYAEELHVKQNFADKFIAQYPGLTYDTERGVLCTDGVEQSIATQIKAEVAFLTDNPTLPLENLFCSLTNYLPAHESQSKALRIAQKFIDADIAGASRVLFLQGRPGLGKTHLSVAISKEFYQKGEKVFFCQPHCIFEHNQSKVRLAKKPFGYPAKIIILDDWNGEEGGHEITSARDIILEAFNAGGYKILITSNGTYEEFVERTTSSSPKDAARFRDRIKQMFVTHILLGESYRKASNWLDDD